MIVVHDSEFAKLGFSRPASDSLRGHGGRRARIDLAIHVGCPLAVVSLVLVLVISGTVEFAFSVLLDATETARHLFFFHVITEILIVCAVALAFSLVAGAPDSKP